MLSNVVNVCQKVGIPRTMFKGTFVTRILTLRCHSTTFLPTIRDDVAVHSHHGAGAPTTHPQYIGGSMIRLKKTAALALFIALTPMVSRAANENAQPTEPPKSGFRAEMLGQLAEVEKKIEDLAAAVPAEKYSWRPAEGVRSIGEVYMHITGANYFFMTFVGVQPPMKLNPNMEKTVTDKDEIVKKLNPSFEHFRNTLINLADKDLGKTTTMFGNTVTYRNALITALAHLHEHLGQSIAYARMNGVVPPWTAAEQAAAAKKEAKKK
jgi:uncharacterized damage-inducible protein DinB